MIVYIQNIQRDNIFPCCMFLLGICAKLSMIQDGLDLRSACRDAPKVLTPGDLLKTEAKVIGKINDRDWIDWID